MAGLEIELKAGLTASDSAKVARRLKRLTGEEGRRIALAAIYFDTADRRLSADGIAFRIRREGRRLVQTVKAGRSHSRLARQASARTASLNAVLYCIT